MHEFIMIHPDLWLMILTVFWPDFWSLAWIPIWRFARGTSILIVHEPARPTSWEISFSPVQSRWRNFHAWNIALPTLSDLGHLLKIILMNLSLTFYFFHLQSVNCSGIIPIGSRCDIYIYSIYICLHLTYKFNQMDEYHKYEPTFTYIYHKYASHMDPTVPPLRRQVCIAEVEEIVPVGALSPEESVRRSDLLGKRFVFELWHRQQKTVFFGKYAYRYLLASIPLY